MVTHGINHLPQCDQIIVLTGGRISEIGSYGELLDADGAFAEFIRVYSGMAEEEGEGEGEGAPSESHEAHHFSSNTLTCVLAIKSLYSTNINLAICFSPPWVPAFLWRLLAWVPEIILNSMGPRSVVCVYVHHGYIVTAMLCVGIIDMGITVQCVF